MVLPSDPESGGDYRPRSTRDRDSDAILQRKTKRVRGPHRRALILGVLKRTNRRGSKMIRRITICNIIALLLPVVLFLALSHLPCFTISQIQVKIDGQLSHVPSKAATMLSTLVGQGNLSSIALVNEKADRTASDRLLIGPYELCRSTSKRRSPSSIRRLLFRQGKNAPIWSMGGPLFRLRAAMRIFGPIIC